MEGAGGGKKGAVLDSQFTGDLMEALEEHDREREKLAFERASHTCKVPILWIHHS